MHISTKIPKVLFMLNQSN